MTDPKPFLVGASRANFHSTKGEWRYEQSAQRWLALGGWILLSFLPSAAGAAFEPSANPWYQQLAKPSWNPPSWVFAPVWTTLYLMMAVAAWLVWQQGGWARQKLPLGLFVAQLGLNALWTPLFFGWQSPGWALLNLEALWLLLVVTTLAFWQVSRAAGALLVPYLGWITFAGWLNFSIWRMNP